MIQRKLFKKKKNTSKIIAIIILINIIILSFWYFLKISKLEYYIIQPNYESFYFIPENKGGKDVPNQNKKGLHLSYVDKNLTDFINKDNLKYSIQIFSHSKYDFINKMRNDLIVNKSFIFTSEDLFILIFESTIGKEYFLLFKNFETRVKANNYCKKYVNFLDNCLIVNAQNLD